MLNKSTVVLVTYLLLLIGLILVFSSTVVHSLAVFGNPHTFFILHLSWVVLGIIAFSIFSGVNYEFLVNQYKVLFWLSTSMLILLAIASFIPCSQALVFAKCVNEANRWLYLPSVPYFGDLNFQPAELAKLAVIIYLSVILSGKHTKNTQKDNSVFWIFLKITGFISALILLQPNMSTALMIIIICSSIYLVSGHTLKPFAVFIPILMILTLIFMFSSPYRRERVFTYLNPDKSKSATEESYQINQVKIGLGAGGLFGVGLGNSRQKYKYLPEVASDSMFAIIGEEFGYVGTFFVCILFLFLVYEGFRIAQATQINQKRLIAVGITVWIGIQFLLHVMANTGLIPYTGVPMPFISYGGSSMLFSMSALGLLVNISKNP